MSSLSPLSRVPRLLALLGFLLAACGEDKIDGVVEVGDADAILEILLPDGTVDFETALPDVQEGDGDDGDIAPCPGCTGSPCDDNTDCDSGYCLEGPSGKECVRTMIYVWQSDAFRDIPVRIMAIAAALGIASGVGWWLAAGKVLADSYGVTTASSLALTKVVSTGFLITLGGTALMLLPAVVTRLFPLPVRESLDGFVIGSFGALWYQTAATATTLAPQFAEGLMLEQSATRILADSLTYGVVTPLATTAAGGLVGLSRWFRADRRPGRTPGRARAALTICTVVAVGLYVTVWAVDSLSLSRMADVSLKLVVAVLAVLTARSAVQIALLHEAPDPAKGAPVLCVHCEAVVPDLPFCCACGAAARASSRSSRRFRRENPPARELSPT